MALTCLHHVPSNQKHVSIVRFGILKTYLLIPKLIETHLLHVGRKSMRMKSKYPRNFEIIFVQVSYQLVQNETLRREHRRISQDIRIVL